MSSVAPPRPRTPAAVVKVRPRGRRQASGRRLAFPAMTTITRLALRHRRLVALAWIILTVAGVLTVSSATSRLSHGFNTPGTAGYDANQHLWQRFGIDGNEQPTIAVAHLPAGQGMDTAAGRAAAARTFTAAARAGHLAVADYANTHNAKLISSDRTHDLGADRHAQSRPAARCGRDRPDHAGDACLRAGGRLRVGHGLRADPERRRRRWWRAERADRDADRRRRCASGAAVRLRVGDRDRAVADRDPVDPDQLPARARADAARSASTSWSSISSR